MSRKSTGRTLSRRSFVKGSIAISGGLALASFGGAELARAQVKKFTFITPWNFLIGFAPTLNAHAAGHFKRGGLESAIIGGKGAAMAVQQTLTGRAQFARVSAIDVVNAVGNQGAPLVAVGTISQASVFSVVSSPENPIRSPKDMAGKVIGVTSFGGGTENLLDMMLAKNGIDPESVQREAVGNAPGAFELVKRGKIAAYMPSTGTVVVLRSTGEDIHAWSTDDEVPAPGQVYITTRETAEKDPDLVVEFLRAIKSSVEQITTEDPLAVIDRLDSSFEMLGTKDRPLAAKQLQGDLALLFAEGKENLLRNVESRWNSITDNMVKAGLAKQVEAASLYTNRFVDKLSA